jgi:hypothetical protein
LTLAFTGFPPQLVRLKHALNDFVSLKENPGSLWPKATLGCLRDDVRLTPTQLDVLLGICREHSARLAAAAPLVVRQLQVKLFRCRSLEEQLSCSTLPLLEPVDDSPPDSAELRHAASVANEVDDATAFWFNVSKDGQRAEHYRGSATGATLVAPLRALHALGLDDFRREVDQKMGPLYVWFDAASTHMTVRALL